MDKQTVTIETVRLWKIPALARKLAQVEKNEAEIVRLKAELACLTQR